MAFKLFLLVNAVLFIRPAEMFPAVEGWPFYEVLMVACLALSAIRLQKQLTLPSLVENPLHICVAGMFVAVVFSQITNLAFGKAASAAFEYGKVVAYYLLFVTLVDSKQKLRQFLIVLTGLIVVLATLPVLHHWGTITLTTPSHVEEYALDDATNEIIMVSRLQTIGLGPNELATTIAVGILLCLYCNQTFTNRLWRWLVLVPLLPMGYAFALTQSRGGMLALIAGLLVLFHARYGKRKTLILGGLTTVALLILFSGRMTDTSALEAGSGQQRIQIWSDGLAMFQENPLFGIGYGEYRERVGYEAHNSFIHCFAELGLFGGCQFLGAFFFVCWALTRLGPVGAVSAELELPDTDVWQMRPFLLAVLAAYGVGMLSLSRSYVVPTYTMLGLTTVWFRAAQEQWIWPELVFNKRFVQRALVVSAGFLVVTQVSVQLLLRW